MRVFIFEDDKNRIKVFTKLLAKRDVEYIDICDNIEVAKGLLTTREYDVAFLDHDMDYRIMVNSQEPNTGYQLCKFIVEKEINLSQVFIHSLNPVGGDNMMRELQDNLNIRSLYRTPFPSLVALLKL